MKNRYLAYSRQHIDKSDIGAVNRALRSDIITRGNIVREFESTIADKFNTKYAVTVNSASSALLLACHAINLKKNDIMWTSSITYAASANCGLLCQATVDFLDIDHETKNISISKLKRKLEIAKKNQKLPKVLIIVHLAGNPINLVEINKLSKKYKFKIIADCSHSMGSKFRNDLIGSSKICDMNVFSFHPVKSITTGEGGAILTDNETLYKKIKLLRSNGIDKDFKRNNFPYDWYYNQIDVGYNFNMSDINAALGLNQLKKLDYFIEKRNFLADIYKKQLNSLPLDFQEIDKKDLSSYHLFIIQFREYRKNKNRDFLYKKLKQNYITTNLHYIPLYRHSVYRKYNFKKTNFPNSENYFKNALSIPLHQQLKRKDIDYISEKIKNYF